MLTLLSNRQEFLTRDGKERKAARSQGLLLLAMASTIHATSMLPKEDGANMPGAGLIPTSCWHHAPHALSGSTAEEYPKKRQGQLAPLMIKD